jgi:hypothetical protein
VTETGRTITENLNALSVGTAVVLDRYHRIELFNSPVISKNTRYPTHDNLFFLSRGDPRLPRERDQVVRAVRAVSD